MLQGVMGPLEETTIARCRKLLNIEVQSGTSAAKKVI